NGTMVHFKTGTAGVVGETKVAFVTRDGKQELLPLPAGGYSEPRISPDSKQLAVLANGDQGEAFLSLYDLSQATALRRLTFQSVDDPVWTRDGRIIFQSAGALFWQRADGNGAAEELLKHREVGFNYPSSVSREGKTLLFRSTTKQEGIWTLALDG